MAKAEANGATEPETWCAGLSRDRGTAEADLIMALRIIEGARSLPGTGEGALARAGQLRLVITEGASPAGAAMMRIVLQAEKRPEYWVAGDWAFSLCYQAGERAILNRR